MYLTLAIRRHFILNNKIPAWRHPEAFGTYCMSHDKASPRHDDPSHPVNVWLRSKNRKALLSSCAALLCWDQSGKMMILSAPTLCIDENSSEDEVLVIAQRGNAVDRNRIVSIPVTALHQSVVGFVPERVHPAMETDKLHEANDLYCEGIDVPTYKDSATFMARLPVVVPLGFGHGIDEDLSKDMISLKLAANHPYYSTWIESTGWLYQSLKGNSLQPGDELMAGGSFMATSSLMSPSSHQEGSHPWNHLCRDLERIRNENLERFLDSNKGYYEEPLLTPEELDVQHQASQMESAESESTTKNQMALFESVDTTGRRMGSEERNGQEQSSSPSNGTAGRLANLPSFEVGTPPQPVSPSDCETARSQDAKDTEEAHMPSPPMLQDTNPAGRPQELPRSDCSAGLQDKNVDEEAHLLSPPRLPQDRDSAGLDPVPTRINLPWTNEAAVKSNSSPKEQHGTEMVVPQEPEPRKRPAAAVPEVIHKKQKNWGKVEDKILTALAEFLALNMEQPPILLVALFADYSNPASAGFTSARRNLEKEDIVKSFKGGAIGLTDLGKKYMPLVDPPKSDAEVHKRLLAMIQKKPTMPKKVKDLWEELSDGDEHDMKSVASAIGYTNVQSAGFKDSISALSKINFIIYDKSKKILQLASFLFPFKNAQVGDEGDDEDDDLIYGTQNSFVYDPPDNLSPEAWETNVVSI